MPSAPQIALLRADIDRRPHRIKGVLTDAGIRRHIFGDIPDDEKKAVDAFTKMNQSNALKTRPNVGVYSHSSSFFRPSTKPHSHSQFFPSSQVITMALP